MHPTDRKLRVFLCHASQDKPIVRELYQRLLAEGWIDPWLDEEKLLPGQDWDMEIEKAVEASDAVIVCVSNNSITKAGYVQKELRGVLDVAEYKPEGAVFIIPILLESCQLPRRLKDYQYQDYFTNTSHAYNRLRSSLETRANAVGVDIVEIKKNLQRQEQERVKRERDEQIRREAEERIRREEEKLIRKQAEERARIEITELARKDTERKKQLTQRYAKILSRLSIIGIVFVCSLLSWAFAQVYSFLNTTFFITPTPSSTGPDQITQTPSYINSTILISDNFDGSDLDTSLWDFTSNSSGADYSISNGYLTIESGSTRGGGGAVLSQEKFFVDTNLYRLEVRVKVDLNGEGSGAWGFWGDGADGIASIGINPPFEGVLTHVRQGNSGGVRFFNIGVGLDDWHTYTVDFFSDKIEFYVDGSLQYTETNEIPVKKSLRIRLDCGSTGINRYITFDRVSLSLLTP